MQSERTDYGSKVRYLQPYNLRHSVFSFYRSTCHASSHLRVALLFRSPPTRFSRSASTLQPTTCSAPLRNSLARSPTCSLSLTPIANTPLPYTTHIA